MSVPRIAVPNVDLFLTRNCGRIGGVFQQPPKNISVMAWSIKKSLLLACLTLGCASNVRAMDATPGVTLLEPASRAIVRPNEEVAVNVKLDPAISATEMWIVGYFDPYDGAPKIVPGPPFITTYGIPERSTGSGKLLIVFGGDNLQQETAASVSLMVVPDDPISHINVSDPRFILDPPNTDGTFNEYKGLRRIDVYAFYENGIDRPVTESILGTTYTSLDPSIATVTSEGIIEPVSEGLTYIEVSHRGFTAFAEVTVAANPRSLPPLEATGDFLIESSGFRRDFESGLFRQVVRITNEAQHPYSKLHVMLSGLPDNIKLFNADGESENMTPIGAPYVFVSRPPGDDFLESGESVEIELEFANPEGAPITYTPRVIAVSDP
jgi:hypothetical protein